MALEWADKDLRVITRLDHTYLQEDIREWFLNLGWTAIIEVHACYSEQPGYYISIVMPEDQAAFFKLTWLGAC